MNNPDYIRIEQAISYLEVHAEDQPSLEDVADHIGLSPYHFQRLFKRWAGVSPKKFLQYLTVESAKQLLRDSASVLDASYQVGLSGPGRLHDLFVNVEAVTPGEFKSLGDQLEIRYGFHMTPFGECLIAETGRGISNLEFIIDGNRESALKLLQAAWKAARLKADKSAGEGVVDRIFNPAANKGNRNLKILLTGTNFQLKVWQALLRIPEGELTTYGRLADAIGHPGSSRAVGNAVGCNPVACLVPCHRVLRASGKIGGYKWGAFRKRAMIAREAARFDRRL